MAEPPPERDDAARAAVWRGALPAVFELATDEITTVVPPRAFQLCLPRQTLLPFVCEGVRACVDARGRACA